MFQFRLYYFDNSNVSVYLQLCISCHSECDGCTGFGADECIRCKNHLKEGKCVAE